MQFGPNRIVKNVYTKHMYTLYINILYSACVLWPRLTCSETQATQGCFFSPFGHSVIFSPTGTLHCLSLEWNTVTSLVIIAPMTSLFENKGAAWLILTHLKPGTISYIFLSYDRENRSPTSVILKDIIFWFLSGDGSAVLQCMASGVNCSFVTCVRLPWRTHLCVRTQICTHTETPAFSAENQRDNYKAISRQILTGSLTEGIWQLS